MSGFSDPSTKRPMRKLLPFIPRQEISLSCWLSPLEKGGRWGPPRFTANKIFFGMRKHCLISADGFFLVSGLRANPEDFELRKFKNLTTCDPIQRRNCETYI